MAPRKASFATTGDGPAGAAIPLPARLMALAEVYDALASQRVCKPPFPHQLAWAMIVAGISMKASCENNKATWRWLKYIKHRTDQQRSKIAAMPWPPPMHIVTSA